jgi:Domain of unknown function (DUF4214)
MIATRETPTGASAGIQVVSIKDRWKQPLKRYDPMTWLSRVSSISSRRMRPKVEQLEDRRLLAVTYHGGPLLSHVEVEPVFYGQYWNSAAGQQQASDLDSFLSYLTNSSYMDMLAQYRVGRGDVAANGIVAGATSAAASVDDITLQQTLANGITDGSLLPADVNRLYIVFTAPNMDVTKGNQDSVNNFFGYHDYFTGPAGAPAYYAVIAHPVGNGTFYNLNVFQTLTKTVSHELAEAVTDPGVGGWYDARTGNEIGDLADSPRDVGLLNGYIVQAEWSAQLRTSVLPPDAQWIDASLVSSKPIPATLDEVAIAFTRSDEYFADVVTEDYLQLLHRTPSHGEVSSWVSLMKNGLTDEQLLAGFTSSMEYYQQAGGTDQAWIDALYLDVLGRAADATGEAAWLNVLASGSSRFRIAYGFAASVEHESIVIAGDYQRILGRAASPSEIAGWVGNMQEGVSDEQLVAAFVSSEEFYAAHGSSIQGWLNGAYQVILQRAPDASGLDHWQTYLRNTLVGV